MTRRDYVMLAETIDRLVQIYSVPSTSESYNLKHKHQLDTLNSLVTNLANNLSQDNPKFDRDRFLTACGVKS